MNQTRSVSPSTKYSIIDIRGDINKKPEVDRPATPPKSSGSSEDAFNGNELPDIILSSLSKPIHHKSIPTYVLYDRKGLQIFDQITYLKDEYYLTEAERDILIRKSDELAGRLKEGSVIFELGAGSLRKTQVILDAIEKRKIRVKYFALDLDQYELEKSLSCLKNYKYIQLHGLLGTYDQGIPWISKNYTVDNIQKVFLWLGSSIGNQNRAESAYFLNRIQRMCMESGDYFVIGFDKRKEAAKIELAYNDTKGLTREFIMNGLDHVNQIMGNKNFISRDGFVYDTRYQTEQGRHVAHYRALKDMTISHTTARKHYVIDIKENELIHVEHSYKYSLEEVDQVLTAANMNIVENWLDSKHQYRLVVAEVSPFTFDHHAPGAKSIFLSQKGSSKTESIQCETCNAESFGEDTNEDNQLTAFIKDKSHPTHGIPTLHEWEELWKSWDLVTQNMLDCRTMLFERPIALRHPFIFYLGHIPGFLDIQLSRHEVDKEIGPTSLTEPAHFSDIFERGIDPDMDDPTQCHPHSEVPTQKEDWPSLDAILTYKNKIRERLRRFMVFWESASMDHPQRKRQARIIWMCFEHEAMHLETLLYMLIQSPRALPPPGVSIPFWKMSQTVPPLSPLPHAATVTIPTGVVTLGHNDYEKLDFTSNDKPYGFGWDNEHPERRIAVMKFNIEKRPVTNGEYYEYLVKNSIKTLPVSWIKEKDVIFVRTFFGPCPLEVAQNWPVQVSHHEARAYANYRGGRLPTEAELMHFRQTVRPERMDCETYKVPNIGFKHWTPTDLNNEQVHQLGDLWEWTDTIFDDYPAFEKSEIYPGYSSDFFDEKHRVVLGGSWATHPCIALRKSFRNYYQSKYPYVFSGFRLCYP